MGQDLPIASATPAADIPVRVALATKPLGIFASARAARRNVVELIPEIATQAPMLSGTRELICGLHHDEQFGMTIMLGVGGVLAEALGDVTIRLAPIAEADAHQMIDDLRTAALLGEFRGEPAVDRDAVVSVLLALSAAATSRPDVVSVDVNPLIIVNGQPVAVDALVEVA